MTPMFVLAFAIAAQASPQEAPAIETSCPASFYDTLGIQVALLDLIRHRLDIFISGGNKVSLMLASGDTAPKPTPTTNVRFRDGQDALEIELPPAVPGTEYTVSAEFDGGEHSCHGTVHIITFSSS